MTFKIDKWAIGGVNSSSRIYHNHGKIPGSKTRSLVVGKKNTDSSFMGVLKFFEQKHILTVKQRNERLLSADPLFLP